MANRPDHPWYGARGRQPKRRKPADLDERKPGDLELETEELETEQLETEETEELETEETEETEELETEEPERPALDKPEEQPGVDPVLARVGSLADLAQVAAINLCRETSREAARAHRRERATLAARARARSQWRGENATHTTRPRPIYLPD